MLKEHLGVCGVRAAGREAQAGDPINSSDTGQRCERDEPVEVFGREK